MKIYKKPMGNARKLFCENWGCKVGKDGGGEIQRIVITNKQTNE